MIERATAFLSLALCALTFAACGSSAPRSLVGTWTVDFAATWREIRLHFFEGLSAHSAEEASADEDELHAQLHGLLGPFRFEFSEPATMGLYTGFTIGDRTVRATYTLPTRTGPTWKLKAAEPLGVEARIEWLGSDRIRWVSERGSAPRFHVILQRR